MIMPESATALAEMQQGECSRQGFRQEGRTRSVIYQGLVEDAFGATRNGVYRLGRMAMRVMTEE